MQAAPLRQLWQPRSGVTTSGAGDNDAWTPNRTAKLLSTNQEPSVKMGRFRNAKRTGRNWILSFLDTDVLI